MESQLESIIQSMKPGEKMNIINANIRKSIDREQEEEIKKLLESNMVSTVVSDFYSSTMSRFKEINLKPNSVYQTYDPKRLIERSNF